MLHLSQTALLLIDVQQMFLDREANGIPRNNPEAISNMVRLLEVFRKQKLPLFHIRHASTEADSLLRPELPGFQPIPQVKELSGEPVIVKGVNSAFIGTDLENRLKANGITTILITGITTNHCC